MRLSSYRSRVERDLPAQKHIQHGDRDGKSGIWEEYNTLKGNFSILGELRTCFGTIWASGPNRLFIVFRYGHFMDEEMER